MTKRAAVLLLMVLTVWVSSLGAQAYRWVDENGKVHFGDRPPDKNKAKNISEDIRKQNIDSASSNTKAQVDQINKRQSAEKTEARQLTKGQKERQEKLSKACQDARKRLQVLKGRVIFYDENGNEIKTTEKERAAQAVAMEKEIKKYCR